MKRFLSLIIIIVFPYVCFADDCNTARTSCQNSQPRYNSLNISSGAYYCDRVYVPTYNYRTNYYNSKYYYHYQRRRINTQRKIISVQRYSKKPINMKSINIRLQKMTRIFRRLNKNRISKNKIISQKTDHHVYKTIEQKQ